MVDSAITGEEFSRLILRVEKQGNNVDNYDVIYGFCCRSRMRNSSQAALK
jgi:hypothetical protein